MIIKAGSSELIAEFVKVKKENKIRAFGVSR